LPRVSSPAVFVVFVLLLAIVLPIATVLSFVGVDTQGLWAHLARTVLDRYLLNTLLLVSSVALLAAGTGVGTAWLVTMYEFPLRRVLEFALVLPLAMPAYILAYAYTDLLQVTGPVQSALREATGWGVRDYWFPNVRSLGGAIFVLSAALYPYVYLITRAAFLEQSGSAVEVARTLGLSRFAAFVRIAAPMARPAIVAGTMLVAMETLADFGAVKYFDLEVFATGIYRAWFAYGNPAAAAQLASLLLVAVFAVVVIEQVSRGARRYAQMGATLRDARLWRLAGFQAVGATVLCALPVAFGFALPTAVLVAMSIDAGAEMSVNRLVGLAGNTAGLALIAATMAVALAALVAYASGRTVSLARQLARFAYLGYATPGVVAGVGLLIVAGAVDAGLRAGSGMQGLLLSGSFAALVYAYLVRFFAVAHGPIDAAYAKLGPRYSEAARTLGHKPAAVFWRIDAPLMRGTVLAAAALVFVDVMKELPVTMILRPFNFDTLATEAFQLATTERLDQAALPSLAIAAAGLVPVIVLCLGMRRSRPEAVGVQQ
jgi:iron(III) transport system permease protein